MPWSRVLALNAPPSFLKGLAPDTQVFESASAGQTFDVAMLFAQDRAEAESKFPDLVSFTKPGGVAWLVYRKIPKGDLNRPGVWVVAEPSGWVPVSQIAIDETWSAMRVRPRAEVGT